MKNKITSRNFVALLTTLLVILLSNTLKAQHVNLVKQGTPTSIRGLSVVNDSIAWISGSKGYIAITRNGGKTWAWQQIKGFEKADFRDIEAFSGKEAIIMSSGTPALVLKTTDGGVNWQLKYKNTDTAYFFDAMDFADAKRGYILGDPINDKYLLMETIDSGSTWHPFTNCPEALPNEASFAASGTCLRVNKKNIYIISGGSNARIFIDDKKINQWTIAMVSITKGQSSKGAFSVAIKDNLFIAVGGDYAHDKQPDSLASYSTNNGKSWQLSDTFPSGFQSCVEYINAITFLSTGTPGTNITTDGGRSWTKIDSTSFNVCRKAKHGSLVLLAGNGGKIGILKP